jgi:hypothetical protein
MGKIVDASSILVITRGSGEVYKKELEGLSNLPRDKAVEVDVKDYAPRKPDSVAMGLREALTKAKLDTRFHVASRKAGGENHVYIMHGPTQHKKK